MASEFFVGTIIANPTSAAVIGPDVGQTANLSSRERFRVQLGLVLVVVFAVHAVFALRPLQQLAPLWQLRLAGVPVSTAPLVLLGCALISLRSEPRSDRPTSPEEKMILRRILQLDPLAALGFDLLIPLPLNAVWSQLRSADSETQKTLRSIQRRLDPVKRASTDADLRQLAQGLPADWQPGPGNNPEGNRQRLLERIAPELARLKSQSENRKRQTLEKALQDVLRDSLITFLYGCAFEALSPNGSSALNLITHGRGTSDSDDRNEDWQA